uniref:Uncharacterized protein n=1 Tax=Latimeria chalumnae TaxID=7897 RepID=H3B9B4_LATCH
SFVQDLTYGIMGGVIKTAKQILLPWAVKSLTGNVELIKILNRLRHGISYSKLEEIDTVLCLQTLATEEEQGVVMPTYIHPCIPTILAYDNIDGQEETLSGEGTSHRVNGIIVQPKIATAEPPKPKAPIQKEKKRSITPTPLFLPHYNAGDKSGPPALTPLQMDSEHEAKIAHQKETTNQKIVLRMGVFHTICNLLSIIGKRYGDAGLRDLAVESGVIAEGSITSVLEGRKYNRGVCLHKLVYEALPRIACKGFYPWLEE